MNISFEHNVSTQKASEFGASGISDFWIWDAQPLLTYKINIFFFLHFCEKQHDTIILSLKVEQNRKTISIQNVKQKVNINKLPSPEKASRITPLSVGEWASFSDSEYLTLLCYVTALSIRYHVCNKEMYMF